jgi:hypothetical protein
MEQVFRKQERYWRERFDDLFWADRYNRFWVDREECERIHEFDAMFDGMAHHCWSCVFDLERRLERIKNSSRFMVNRCWSIVDKLKSSMEELSHVD